MSAETPAIERFFAWRVKGVWLRAGQDVLVGGLVWFMTGRPLALAWVAAILALGLIDAAISKRQLSRTDRSLSPMLALLFTGLTSSVFASIACVLILVPKAGYLSGALLILCATNLNNAIMSRGTQRGTAVAVAPSCIMAVAAPLLSVAFGYGLDLKSLAVLECGVVAYVIFTALLASTLGREGRALRQASRNAEMANLAKREFLSVISHEVRTPLNGVLGTVQVMERGELSDEQRANLQVIGQSGAVLMEMVNDILDLCRIDAGKLELEDRGFDIGQLMTGVHTAFAAQAATKGLSFSLELAEEVRGGWRGDPVRIRQVLFNLVSNAVKFTHAGMVRIEARATPTGVEIAVIDSGVGIEEGRVGQMFDRFVQGDSSSTRAFGGAGLGLAIGKELCGAMGGTIAVQTELGAGSRFTVDLPLARDEACGAGPDDRAWTGAGEQEQPLKVLAAEDNPVNQRLLKALLGEVGVDVTMVENGADAVEAWEREHWDVILMDVQMPVMDGPTATRAIRAREAELGRPVIPIIAVTANVMPQQLQAYRQAGMDDVVAKPLDVSVLFGAIAQAVEGAQAQVEAA
jgi:signal transduction histidine kinase/CheY-like chemotaxis protein